MNVVRIGNISAAARNLFSSFKAKPGSEHIANLVAIEALLQVLWQFQPKRVLEIGAGIGTLSYLVLEHSDAELVAIEDDEFCLRELSKNLAGCRPYKVCGYDGCVDGEYDLIVVDGGGQVSRDGMSFTEYAVGRGAKVVFVEGKRRGQRIAARKAMSNYCVYRTVQVRGPEGKGGYVIEAIGRGSPVSRPLWHFYHEHIDAFVDRVLRKLRKLKGQAPGQPTATSFVSILRTANRS